MITPDLISKSLDDAIIKCSESQDIRSNGASYETLEQKNSDGSTTLTYKYKDGTEISMIYDKPLTMTADDGYTYDATTDLFTTVKYDGKEYHLNFGDSDKDTVSDEFFQYQKDTIIEEYGDDGWEFFCRYSNEFGTAEGWNLNSLLRGQKTVDDITDEDGDFYISPFLLENHARFVEMEKSLSLDREDSVTLRLTSELHRNSDGISKKIVSDKGHISTSMTGQIDNYDTYGDIDNSWFIFTLNDKGSGARGAYLGTAIKEIDGYDFEREVNYVPGQKFERLLIDEGHKFIIQKPIL